MVHKALDSAKIKHFEVDGYEADDLIGTIAKSAKGKDLQTIIVSGDRDLLQLVNNKVLMLAPIIGMTKMTMFDETKVREKYGLEPWQIVDYKALVGDASDNYPGVTGIGPKTASTLLAKYQTLEGLYEHLAELSPQIQEKLAQDAEQAALAKKLATIVVDAPVRLEEAQAELGKIDKKELKMVFEKFGFKSLLGRLEKEAVRVQNPPSSKTTKDKDDSEQMNLL
jgi:DNA polymerase-1